MFFIYKREGERERKKERKRERERERKKERKKERERERISRLHTLFCPVHFQALRQRAQSLPS